MELGRRNGEIWGYLEMIELNKGGFSVGAIKGVVCYESLFEYG